MTPVEASNKRRAFCAQLKSERERRGMSIADIAASTKIKGSLLEALERSDLSRWPKGIYRRAFFRDYVAAIGLSPDAMVSDFLDVFAENEAAPGAAPAVVSEPVSFRLLYESEAGKPGASTLSLALPLRLLGAAFDIALIAALGAAVAAVIPFDLPRACLAIAALYYAGTAWFDMRLGEWVLGRLRRRTPARATVETFSPSTLPYNAYAPATLRQGSATPSKGGRGWTLFREYAGRLSEAPSFTLSSQRRRDLASVRRQRAETANRAVDEMSVT